MDISSLTGIIGYLVYTSQAIIALWGAYCVVTVWRRLGQLRFRTEESQESLLATVENHLEEGNFDAVSGTCVDDSWALSQLVVLAIRHRNREFTKLRHQIIDRFQRDVLADLEHRMSWIGTVIKSSPMLGLFGTVIGMMGAFEKLGSGQKVDTSRLATDISLALITTAVGLAIAIPLVICLAGIDVRVRQMEDLVSAGLTRFFDGLKAALAAAPPRR